MKSSIKKTNEKPEEPKFPVLKEWSTNELIVLFFGETDGVCVHSGSSVRKVGERSPWVSCFNSEWSDFKGKVILEN